MKTFKAIIVAIFIVLAGVAFATDSKAFVETTNVDKAKASCCVEGAACCVTGAVCCETRNTATVSRKACCSPGANCCVTGAACCDTKAAQAVGAGCCAEGASCSIEGASCCPATSTNLTARESGCKMNTASCGSSSGCSDKIAGR